MPRSLKIPTREMGDLDLYLIYQYGETWEPEWRPLQGTELAKLTTHISKETLDHALHGYTSPFVKALGLPPWGALRKVPTSHAVCAESKYCPSHNPRTCRPSDPKRPWCYQPGGFEDPEVRKQASELIRLWGEGVYVIVVQEDETNG